MGGGRRYFTGVLTLLDTETLTMLLRWDLLAKCPMNELHSVREISRHP